MMDFFHNFAKVKKQEDPLVKGLKSALSAAIEKFKKESMIDVGSHMAMRIFDNADLYWLEKPQITQLTAHQKEISKQHDLKGVLTIAQQLLNSNDNAFCYCVAVKLAKPLKIGEGVILRNKSLDMLKERAAMPNGQQLIANVKQAVDRLLLVGPTFKNQ